MNDRHLMERAIVEAEKCRPSADRIPKVGAIVAVGDVVIGQGHRGTGNDGDDDHAEMWALAGVSDRLQLPKATIYTTLEPCTPEVRSNPQTCCTALITQAEVKKVFIGILDPNQGVRGKGLWTLQDRGIEVELFPPDLAAKIRAFNDKFIRTQQTLGMRITNLRAGQKIDTTKSGGVFVVAGKCLNPPGDNVFVFTNNGGQWWPQPHKFEMTGEREWRVSVHFGKYGPHTVYVVKANELGTTLVNYYRKTCNVQLERVRMLRGKLKLDADDERDFLRTKLPGPYQGIEIGSLPKGLELQDKVDIIVQRSGLESLDEIFSAVPAALVPGDGKWTAPAIIKANEVLSASVLGNTAMVQVVVDHAERTPEGRYEGTPRLIARLPSGAPLNLQYVVWAYFSDADQETIQRFRSLRKSDIVKLLGKVARVDIDEVGNSRLNVDLLGCRFVE